MHSAYNFYRSWLAGISISLFFGGLFIGHGLSSYLPSLVTDLWQVLAVFFIGLGIAWTMVTLKWYRLDEIYFYRNIGVPPGKDFIKELGVGTKHRATGHVTLPDKSRVVVFLDKRKRPHTFLFQKDDKFPFDDENLFVGDEGYALSKSRSFSGNPSRYTFSF